MSRMAFPSLIAVAMLAFTSAAYAQPTLKDPWGRGTVPQQKVTGKIAHPVVKDWIQPGAPRTVPVTLRLDY
jgi:hypothetical protein